MSKQRTTTLKRLREGAVSPPASKTQKRGNHDHVTARHEGGGNFTIWEGDTNVTKKLTASADCMTLFDMGMHADTITALMARNRGREVVSILARTEQGRSITNYAALKRLKAPSGEPLIKDEDILEKLSSYKLYGPRINSIIGHGETLSRAKIETPAILEMHSLHNFRKIKTQASEEDRDDLEIMREWIEEYNNHAKAHTMSQHVIERTLLAAGMSAEVMENISKKYEGTFILKSLAEQAKGRNVSNIEALFALKDTSGNPMVTNDNIGKFATIGLMKRRFRSMIDNGQKLSEGGVNTPMILEMHSVPNFKAIKEQAENEKRDIADVMRDWAREKGNVSTKVHTMPQHAIERILLAAGMSAEVMENISKKTKGWTMLRTFAAPAEGRNVSNIEALFALKDASATPMVTNDNIHKFATTLFMKKRINSMIRNAGLLSQAGVTTRIIFEAHNITHFRDIMKTVNHALKGIRYTKEEEHAAIWLALYAKIDSLAPGMRWTPVVQVTPPALSAAPPPTVYTTTTTTATTTTTSHHHIPDFPAVAYPLSPPGYFNDVADGRLSPSGEAPWSRRFTPPLPAASHWRDLFSPPSPRDLLSAALSRPPSPGPSMNFSSAVSRSPSPSSNRGRSGH